MAVIIQNLGYIGESEVCQYVLRINEQELVHFKHPRKAGMSACLRAAADAFDRVPCTLGMGCDQTGVCYANQMGKPEECGKN